MASISTTQRRTSHTYSGSWLASISRPSGKMDYGLLIATIALVGIGLMMVYSASLFVSLKYQDGEISYYFMRQMAAAGLGLVGIVGLLTIDYHLIRRFSIPAILGTMVLLLVVLGLGDTLLGARRGLHQGSFQPSELAKIITIFYIADWLSSKGERIKDFGMGFVPFVVLVGIVGGLIAVQPDLSTSVLIGLVALTMFFVAGARLSHFALILMVGTAAVFAAISVFPHAAERWNDYWIMVQDPSQAEWHIKQVFYGLARGGLFGQGLGNSFQKTGPLPVPHTDSILAVIGEELGLIGCLGVLGLLLFICYRGFRIMLETEDLYGQLMAMGVTAWLIYQALVNAAVMTGIIPFTGLPFPFVSYGGSSMFISLVGVGVLLSISQHNRRLEDGLARPSAGGGAKKGTTKPLKRESEKRVRPKVGTGSLRRKTASKRRRASAAVSVGRRNGRTYLSRASHRR